MLHKLFAEVFCSVCSCAQEKIEPFAAGVNAVLPSVNREQNDSERLLCLVTLMN